MYEIIDSLLSIAPTNPGYKVNEAKTKRKSIRVINQGEESVRLVTKNIDNDKTTRSDGYNK